MAAKEKKAWNKNLDKLSTESKKLDTEIEEIKNNKIYENAFEWRFEFPEVLNDKGDFVGFDVVIGNPPYVRVRDNSRKYFFENYIVSENQFDLYQCCPK
jgi:adenine-specific DNA-methyltransferase